MSESDLSKMNGSELEAFFWNYTDSSAECKKCSKTYARGKPYTYGFMASHENTHIREMGYDLIPGFSPNSVAIRKRSA